MLLPEYGRCPVCSDAPEEIVYYDGSAMCKRCKAKLEKLSMDNYTPKIGDAISARRKVKSSIYKNHVVGPVVDVWDNACRVVTNPGTEIEGDFRLYFSEWRFQFLHTSPGCEYVEKIKRVDEIDWLKFLIKSVVDSLPQNKDWLDPDIEKAMREIRS